jgi:hypothetical protein
MFLFPLDTPLLKASTQLKPQILGSRPEIELFVSGEKEKMINNVTLP